MVLRFLLIALLVTVSWLPASAAEVDASVIIVGRHPVYGSAMVGRAVVPSVADQNGNPILNVLPYAFYQAEFVYDLSGSFTFDASAVIYSVPCTDSTGTFIPVVPGESYAISWFSGGVSPGNSNFIGPSDPSWGITAEMGGLVYPMPRNTTITPYRFMVPANVTQMQLHFLDNPYGDNAGAALVKIQPLFPVIARVYTPGIYDRTMATGAAIRGHGYTAWSQTSMINGASRPAFTKDDAVGLELYEVDHAAQQVKRWPLINGIPLLSTFALDTRRLRIPAIWHGQDVSGAVLSSLTPTITTFAQIATGSVLGALVNKNARYYAQISSTHLIPTQLDPWHDENHYLPASINIAETQLTYEQDGETGITVLVNSPMNAGMLPEPANTERQALDLAATQMIEVTTNIVDHAGTWSPNDDFATRNAYRETKPQGIVSDPAASTITVNVDSSHSRGNDGSFIELQRMDTTANAVQERQSANFTDATNNTASKQVVGVTRSGQEIDINAGLNQKNDAGDDAASAVTTSHARVDALRTGTEANGAQSFSTNPDANGGSQRQVLGERVAGGRIGLHPDTIQQEADTATNNDLSTARVRPGLNLLKASTGEYYRESEQKRADAKPLDEQQRELIQQVLDLGAAGVERNAVDRAGLTRKTAFDTKESEIYVRRKVVENLEGGRIGPDEILPNHMRTMLSPVGLGPDDVTDLALHGTPNPGSTPKLLIAKQGDNPVSFEPYNAESGAPFYDLDGDGDLDRYNTTDPFPSEFDRLRIRWNYYDEFLMYRGRIFPSKKRQIGDRDIESQATWLVSGLSVPDEDGIRTETPLFTIADPISRLKRTARPSLKKGLKSLNIYYYYTAALDSFLDIIPPRDGPDANWFRLGLRFAGASKAAQNLAEDLAKSHLGPVSLSVAGTGPDTGRTLTVTDDGNFYADQPFVDFVSDVTIAQGDLLASAQAPAADPAGSWSEVPTDYRPMRCPHYITETEYAADATVVAVRIYQYPPGQAEPVVSDADYVAPVTKIFTKEATIGVTDPVTGLPVIDPMTGLPATVTFTRFNWQVKIYDQLAWARVELDADGRTIATYPSYDFQPLNTINASFDRTRPLEVQRSASIDGTPLGIGANAQLGSDRYAQVGRWRWPVAFDPYIEPTPPEDTPAIPNAWTFDYPTATSTSAGGTGLGPFPDPGPDLSAITLSQWMAMLAAAGLDGTTNGTIAQLFSWVYRRDTGYADKDPYVMLQLSSPGSVTHWSGYIGSKPLRITNSGNFTSAEDTLVEWFLRPLPDYPDVMRGTHTTGDIQLKVCEGIGSYLFKGVKRNFHNALQQKKILAEMWSYYTKRIPPLCIPQYYRNGEAPSDHVYQTDGSGRIAMVGNRPLAEAVFLKSHQVKGILTADDPFASNESWKSMFSGMGAGFSGFNTNGGGTAFGDGGRIDEKKITERRKNLLNKPTFIFSGARGREWELDMARRMPVGTRLICVEYDAIDDYYTTSDGFSRRYPTIPSWMYEAKGDGRVKIKGVRTVLQQVGHSKIDFVIRGDSQQFKDATWTNEVALLSSVAESFLDGNRWDMRLGTGLFPIEATTDGQSELEKSLGANKTNFGANSPGPVAPKEGTEAAQNSYNYAFLRHDEDARPAGFAIQAFQMDYGQIAPESGATSYTGVTVPLRHPMVLYYYEPEQWQSKRQINDSGSVASYEVKRLNPTSAVFVRYGLDCEPANLFTEEKWPLHDYQKQWLAADAISRGLNAEERRRARFESWAMKDHPDHLNLVHDELHPESARAALEGARCQRELLEPKLTPDDWYDTAYRQVFHAGHTDVDARAAGIASISPATLVLDDRTVVVTAASPLGVPLPKTIPGDLITLTYEEGHITSSPNALRRSPDELAGLHAAITDAKGVLLAPVPIDSARNPYAWTVPADVPLPARLVIVDPDQSYHDNVGSASYRVVVTRQGAATTSRHDLLRSWVAQATPVNRWAAMTDDQFLKDVYTTCVGSDPSIDWTSQNKARMVAGSSRSQIVDRVLASVDCLVHCTPLKPQPPAPGRKPVVVPAPKAPVVLPVPTDAVAPGDVGKTDPDSMGRATAVPTDRPVGTPLTTPQVLPWTFEGITYTATPPAPGTAPIRPQDPGTEPVSNPPADPGIEPLVSTKPTEPLVVNPPVDPGPAPLIPAAPVKPTLDPPGDPPVKPGLIRNWDAWPGNDPTTGDYLANQPSYSSTPSDSDLAANGVPRPDDGYSDDWAPWAGTTLAPDGSPLQLNPRNRCYQMCGATIAVKKIDQLRPDGSAAVFNDFYEGWPEYVSPILNQVTWQTNVATTFSVRYEEMVYLTDDQGNFVDLFIPGEAPTSYHVAAGTYVFYPIAPPSNINPTFEIWTDIEWQMSWYEAIYWERNTVSLQLSVYKGLKQAYDLILTTYNAAWSDYNTRQADYLDANSKYNVWLEAHNAWQNWTDDFNAQRAAYLADLAAWNAETAAHDQWRERKDLFDAYPKTFQAKHDLWAKLTQDQADYAAKLAAYQAKSKIWSAWLDHQDAALSGVSDADALGDAQTRARQSTWDVASTAFKNWADNQKRQDIDYLTTVAAYVQDSNSTSGLPAASSTATGWKTWDLIAGSPTGQPLSVRPGDVVLLNYLDGTIGTGPDSPQISPDSVACPDRFGIIDRVGNILAEGFRGTVASPFVLSIPEGVDEVRLVVLDHQDGATNWSKAEYQEGRPGTTISTGYVDNRGSAHYVARIRRHLDLTSSPDETHGAISDLLLTTANRELKTFSLARTHQGLLADWNRKDADFQTWTKEHEANLALAKFATAYEAMRVSWVKSAAEQIVRPLVAWDGDMIGRLKSVNPFSHADGLTFESLAQVLPTEYLIARGLAPVPTEKPDRKEKGLKGLVGSFASGLGSSVSDRDTYATALAKKLPIWQAYAWFIDPLNPEVGFINALDTVNDPAGPMDTTPKKSLHTYEFDLVIPANQDPGVTNARLLNLVAGDQVQCIYFGGSWGRTPAGPLMSPDDPNPAAMRACIRPYTTSGGVPATPIDIKDSTAAIPMVYTVLAGGTDLRFSAMDYTPDGSGGLTWGGGDNSGSVIYHLIITRLE